jgi:preprotein translocase subunit YajC
MIDSVQLVLLLVIVTLTLLLIILGVQVFYILRDLRTTIKKTNKILENADAITEGIEGPISAVSSLFLGAKASSLLTIARFVKNFLSKDRTDERRHHRE